MAQMCYMQLENGANQYGRRCENEAIQKPEHYIEDLTWVLMFY